MDTFEVVIPYVVADGEEYTLFSQTELDERRVSEDMLREKAEDTPEKDLRELGLLPAEEAVTEAQLSQARQRFGEQMAQRYRAELEQYEAIVAGAQENGLEIHTATYTLRRPTLEERAAAQEAARSAAGRFNSDLYHGALARKCFASCDREGLPVGKECERLPGEVLLKLGQAAHAKSTLGVGQLAFWMRSRKLSTPAAPCDQTS